MTCSNRRRATAPPGVQMFTSIHMFTAFMFICLSYHRILMRLYVFVKLKLTYHHILMRLYELVFFFCSYQYIPMSRYLRDYLRINSEQMFISFKRSRMANMAFLCIGSILSLKPFVTHFVSLFCIWIQNYVFIKWPYFAII